ncbi:hypothetical protein FOZ63_032414 [Perkinsus olseni]|uniref:Uncharacterized protein n=1 Tax=Perkinsus olseni TaxID=32597 RepID=A0A7J6P368_PEROL|nr:hypothetical protein FOZ63_032414 [Perkinsus olseni]
MYRSLPVCNKICARKVDERNKEIHKQKLKEMRSTVDTREPQVCHLEHMRINAKREQLLEERYCEIDRENRILLQKMSDIMRQPSATLQSAQPTGGMNQQGPVSLNKTLRKRELMRITRENQGILRRIQNAQPQYSHVQWEQSYRQNRYYLRNCCDLPFVLESPRKVQEGDDAMLERGDLSVSRSPGGSAMPTTVDGQAADGNDLRYVLKEGQKLGTGYYLVEMATDGRTLTISAYDGESQKTLELIINEKNHRKLYREVAGDYAKLAARLSIEGDRLVLLPHEPMQMPPELMENATDAQPVPPRAAPPDVSDTPSESLTAEEMVRPSVSSSAHHPDAASVDSGGGVPPIEIAGHVEVAVSIPSSSAGSRAPRVHVRGLTPSTPSVHSGYN